MNTHFYYPDSLREFFPEEQLMETAPDSSQYTRLGWFYVEMTRLTGGSDPMAGGRDLDHLKVNGAMSGKSKTTWTSAGSRKQREKLRGQIRKMIEAGAEYGADAIINVSLYRPLLRTNLGLVMGTYVLCGDLICFEER